MCFMEQRAKKKKINLLMKNLHILFDVGSAKAGLLVRGYICYQVVLEMLYTSSHQLLKTTWSLLSLFLLCIYL